MNGWNKAHPLVVFMYYIGLCMLIMLLQHPFYLLTALIWTLIIWILVERGRLSRKLLLFFVIMGLLVSLGNPLFSHRGATILFYMWDQPITLESIVYGILMMMSLLSILFAFQSYRIVMTGEKTLALFARILPRTALAVRIATRFVPLLIRRWQQVANVQRTQGLLFGQGSWKRKAHDGMSLVSMLLTWSLESAIVSAMSMRARGYGHQRRSIYTRFILTKDDFGMLLAMTSLGIALIIGRMNDFGLLQIYPRLGPLAFSDKQWGIYFLFCLFMLVPLYYQGREILSWLWWKYRTSHLPTPGQNPKR